MQPARDVVKAGRSFAGLWHLQFVDAFGGNWFTLFSFAERILFREHRQLRSWFAHTATFTLTVIATPSLNLASPNIEYIVKRNNTVVAALTYLALETIAPAIWKVLPNNRPYIADPRGALSLENTRANETCAGYISAVSRICAKVACWAILS
jgi:hypothetical protein